jgi:hypothetical protein
MVSEGSSTPEALPGRWARTALRGPSIASDAVMRENGEDVDVKRLNSGRVVRCADRLGDTDRSMCAGWMDGCGSRMKDLERKTARRGKFIQDHETLGFLGIPQSSRATYCAILDNHDAHVRRGGKRRHTH